MKTLAFTALMMIANFSGAIAHADVQPVAAPIVVVATVKVNPADAQLFKQEALAMAALSRTDAGNISYSVIEGTQDPSEFATIEVWDSQADIDQHMANAHMASFFKAVGGLFAPGYPIIKSYQAAK